MEMHSVFELISALLHPMQTLQSHVRNWQIARDELRIKSKQDADVCSFRADIAWSAFLQPVRFVPLQGRANTFLSHGIPCWPWLRRCSNCVLCPTNEFQFHATVTEAETETETYTETDDKWDGSVALIN